MMANDFELPQFTPAQKQKSVPKLMVAQFYDESGRIALPNAFLHA